MKPRRLLLVGLLVGAVSMGAVPLAHATFLNSAAASTTFTTGQLVAPTGLVATKQCLTIALLGLFDERLDLTWTPSTTAWATKQTVVVTGTGGFSYTNTDVAASATSLSVDLGLLVIGGSYTATVRATYGSWSSPTVSASDGTC